MNRGITIASNVGNTDVKATPLGKTQKTLGAKPKAELPIGHYLRENFYIPTSGNFRTQTLTEAMMEVGADRILYSVDSPFEDTAVAAEWFDHAASSDPR